MSPPMNVIRKLPKTNTTHKRTGITSERDIPKVQSKTSTAGVDPRHCTNILTVKFHELFASLALSKRSSSNRKLAARLMVDRAWQQAKRQIVWFALVSFGSTLLLEVLLLGMHHEVDFRFQPWITSTMALSVVLISRLEGATQQAGGKSKSAIVALALTVGEPLGETLGLDKTRDGWVALTKMKDIYIRCIWGQFWKMF